MLYKYYVGLGEWIFCTCTKKMYSEKLNILRVCILSILQIAFAHPCSNTNSVSACSSGAVRCHDLAEPVGASQRAPLQKTQAQYHQRRLSTLESNGSP